MTAKSRKKRGSSKVEQWPYVRWWEKTKSWCVDTRTKNSRCRKFFRTKEEAEAYAAKERIKRGNQGSDSYDDAQLKKYGWTTADAVKFAIDHLRKQEASVPLEEAVKSFLDFKKARVGERRRKDMTQKFGQIKTGIGSDKVMAHLTSDDLLAFLDKIPHPTTRNGFRKELVALWRYAKSKPREWTALALDNLALPLAKEPEKARTILTIDQTKALMKASTDPEVRALNAMVLFGGLRREEVEKVDWDAVDFKTGHINVSADVSKVHRERFAPMPDNLVAWLKDLPAAARKRRDERIAADRAEGKVIDDERTKRNPVVTRTLMHVLRKTWKRAKLHPWPPDAHRHSFISYRRRLIGDAQTALDAGTSEGIIKRHYKRPTTEKDALAYFKIVPLKKN